MFFCRRSKCSKVALAACLLFDSHRVIGCKKSKKYIENNLGFKKKHEKKKQICCAAPFSAKDPLHVIWCIVHIASPYLQGHILNSFKFNPATLFTKVNSVCMYIYVCVYIYIQSMYVYIYIWYIVYTVCIHSVYRYIYI